MWPAGEGGGDRNSVFAISSKSSVVCDSNCVVSAIIYDVIKFYFMNRRCLSASSHFAQSGCRELNALRLLSDGFSSIVLAAHLEARAV
jgi:hypothetical protein